MTTNLGLHTWNPVKFIKLEDDLVRAKEGVKVNKEQIFELGKKIVSRVQSGNNRGTGFFIELFTKNVFFVTTAHTIESKQSVFVSEYDQGLVVQSFASDVCLIDVLSQQEPLDIELLSTVDKEYQATVGTKVYVVGYPLGQNTPMFHTGRISSVALDKFSIDGTILPGHSGSPVLVVTPDGYLRVLGIVTSQAVHSKRQMGALDESPDVTAQVYRNNLTTGIGWALKIHKIQQSSKDIQNDFETETAISVNFTNGVLTMEGVEDSRNKNRGIATWVKGLKDTKTLWKFSDNPHNSRTYNKKGQIAFYQAAINAFAQAYAGNNNANPSNFSFIYDSEPYDATPRNE